jgi:Dolichyl-phosphate-mannose-protein mannosyltransferase
MLAVKNSEIAPPVATDTSEQTLPRRRDRAFWITLAILWACVWLPRLFRSFWIDEAGTFWMAHEGPLAAIQKTWHWPGQSVLYAAIASLFTLNGGPLREFVLRLPTLVGIGVAAYFLFRLAEDGIGKAAGRIALTIFLLYPGTLQLGIQARPYGLALGAVVASCWALYEWIKTRERRFLATYTVASALVIYLHYFFAAVFVSQLLYVLYVFGFERRNVKWNELAASCLAVGLLAAPLIPHLRLLWHEKNTLPFTPAPTVIDLTQAILPPLIAFGTFVAGLLVQLLMPGTVVRARPLPRSFFLLLFCWSMLVPALFFVASVVSPMRVFVPRYLSSAIPAQALLIAYAGYSTFGAVSGQIWALAAVLLTTASPIAIWEGHKPGLEALKPVMEIIHAESNASAPPVFFSSPLPESNFYNWRSGLTAESYLYAAFVAYPIKNKLLPLPYRLTPDAQSYVSEKLQTDIAQEREVLFITHEKDWEPWMIARMKEAGFEAVVQQPNIYTVIIFRRPPGGLQSSIPSGDKRS